MMKTSTSNLSIQKWTQHKPPQMGEDESGDLKTPLKQKVFIKIYTMCL